MLKVSKRGQISPFIVMDVMQTAAERERLGDDVIHMEVGQPSTPAPAKVLAAARSILDRDKIGYTVALGIDSLRERIARHYQDRYSLHLSPANVVVTCGSSGGFLLAFLATFDVGDRVAFVSPGYACYSKLISAVGLEAVEILSGPETRFQPTPALLEQLEKPIDGLLVASPANPTGTMIGHSEMESLCQYCGSQGIRLISDEIYHGITYGTPAVSALSYTGEAIVINSFSKYFSMTGWRLGWMIVPDNILRSIECLAQNIFISPQTLSQWAALAAFDCHEELEGHVARYTKNREILLNELPGMGMGLAPADGAFYIYADISKLTNDSKTFCNNLLRQTGVATTSGIDFDPSRGHRAVRFSFCAQTEEILEAVKRMKHWLHRSYK